MFNPIEVWLPGIICIVIMFVIAFSVRSDKVKGKIISTTIFIPITFLMLWEIVASGLGAIGLVMAAIVILAILFILSGIWEHSSVASSKEETK